MLASAPDTSAEHLAAVRHDAEERRMQERAASKARKEKMLKLEEEARKQVRRGDNVAMLSVVIAVDPCSIYSLRGTATYFSQYLYYQ
jgi:hypothetical protein